MRKKRSVKNSSIIKMKNRKFVLFDGCHRMPALFPLAQPTLPVRFLKKLKTGEIVN